MPEEERPSRRRQELQEGAHGGNPVSPVMVTGGSGFVGGEIVRRLVAGGREVVALARSADAAGAVEALGARPARGDILDRESLVEAMHGCEVVYHAAGLNAFCLRDPEPMYRANVEGTRAVVDAAAHAGVQRIVYTSSAATLGERAGTVGHEGSEHRGWFLSDYERSKYEAEQTATAAALDHSVELVCVNPASVQGPGRTRGTARLLLDLLTGRLPAVVDSHLSVVDVADCAAGHLLAEARGRPRERYVLCGASLTTREAVALLSEVAGVDLRIRFVTPRLALAAGGAGEVWGRLRRRRPRICRELVRTLIHGHAYDGSKAERELGLRYTPIRDSLARSIAWYGEHGYLPNIEGLRNASAG
jgi:dihydroflavonol-4-reductase